LSSLLHQSGPQDARLGLPQPLPLGRAHHLPPPGELAGHRRHYEVTDDPSRPTPAGPGSPTESPKGRSHSWAAATTPAPSDPTPPSPPSPRDAPPAPSDTSH